MADQDFPISVQKHGNRPGILNDADTNHDGKISLPELRQLSPWLQKDILFMLSQPEIDGLKKALAKENSKVPDAKDLLGETYFLGGRAAAEKILPAAKATVLGWPNAPEPAKKELADALSKAIGQKEGTLEISVRDFNYAVKIVSLHKISDGDVVGRFNVAPDTAELQLMDRDKHGLEKEPSFLEAYAKVLKVVNANPEKVISTDQPKTGLVSLLSEGAYALTHPSVRGFEKALQKEFGGEKVKVRIHDAEPPVRMSGTMTVEFPNRSVDNQNRFMSLAVMRDGKKVFVDVADAGHWKEQPQ